MNELVDNNSLKIKSERDAESTLHDQEHGACFEKVNYESNFALKFIISNKNLFKITLKNVTAEFNHKTARKHQFLPTFSVFRLFCYCFVIG